MSVATARGPSVFGSAPTERHPVPSAADAQLQALLKAGWTIAHEGMNEVRLTNAKGKKITHKRTRA